MNNNNKGQGMNISLVGISSGHRGRVDVVVRCDLLGHVICSVEIHNDSKFKCSIWEIENPNEFYSLGESIKEGFDSALGLMVSVAVNNCATYPEHWVVTDLETDYDFLIPKDLLDKEALALYERLNLKPRYPLFGSPKGH